MNKNMTFDVFSKEFQESIIDSLLKDIDFLRRFHSAIKPKYFIDEKANMIASIVLTFYKTYRRSPTLPEITNQILKQYPAPHQRDLVKEYTDYIKQSTARPLPDQAYVTSELKSFVQKAELSELIWQTAHNFNQVNLDALKAKLTDISKIDPTEKDVGISSSDFSAYLLSKEDDPPGVQTTFMSLDACFGGALQPGELFVVMAPPNKGKTHTLVNLGRGMLCAGNNVLHITIGDMSVEKVTDRYISSMTNMNIKDIGRLHLYKEVSRLLNDYQVLTDKTLRIKFFNGQDLTLFELESFLIELRDVHKFKADVVIIDYADLIKPTNTKAEKRHQLSEIYVGLRTIGSNFGIPVVTASQTNRQGGMINYDPKTKKKLLVPQALTMGHVAEDWSKAATADYIVSLRDTIGYSKLTNPQDKILQMDLLKSRSSGVDQVFYFKNNFANSRLDEFEIDKDDFEAEISGKPRTVNDIIT